MSFIDFDTPTESADGFVDFTKPQEQIGDTAKGFKRAFAQIPELAYGAGALASMSAEHLFGEGGLSTAAKNYFGEKFAAKQAENQKYAPAVEFTDAWENLKSGDIGSMVDWLQDSAGYVAGQAIQTAVTGGIGAAVGKAGLSAATQKMLGGVVAKQAAKIAEESVAKQGLNAAAAEAAIKAALPGATKIAAQRTAQVIGAGIALNAQNLGMEAGDIYGGLTEEAAKTGREITGDDLLRAWGAAAAAAGTETATDLLGLGAVTGRIKIGGKSMQAMTGAGGKVARAGAAASVGVPIEAGQEYVQTGLEQYGAGRPTDTPEAERERINAAAVGGLGGGVVGAGAGIISSAQQPTQQSPGITPTSTPSIAQAAAEEEQKTAAGIQAIESAQDIEGITAAAIEATSQPVGPNPFVPDAEPAEFIQSEARDKNAIPAEQQVAQARSAELDAIQSGDAPNNPPVGDVGIAMQKAQQARAEQDRLALESQQSEAEKARRAKLAPQPADLPILQRIIKREPVTDAEARPLLAKGFIGTRPDGTYKVIEKGLKARNLLLRQAAVHKMGTIAPNLGMIAPEAGSDIPNVGSQLPNLGTEAGNDNIAPVIEQKPVIQPTTVAEQPIPPPSETITPKVVGGIPVSAQSDEQSQAIPATNPTIVAQSPEIAPTPSTIAPNNVSQTVQNEPIRAANEAKPRPVFGPDYEFEARNRAALKAEKDAQAVTAAAQSVSAVETLVQKSPAFTPAEQTVKPNANLSNSRGLEVAPESKGATVKKSLTPEAERFQGQLKKGMSERVARQQQTRLTKEQHNLVWTVEKSTVPEFPDRFDVVGRKPVVDQNAPEQSTKGTQEPTKAFTTAQASTQPPKVASPELEPRPAAQEPPTAAQPAAPAQPTANGEKEAQASVSQAHIPQYGKDAEMRRRIVQQSEERGFTLDERVESAISKINGGYTLAATAEALQYARGEPLQGVAKDDPVATLRYLAGKTDKQDLPFTNRAKEVLSALGEPVNTPPAPAKEAAKETDRIAEIDAELAKLQAQYEKKSAGGKLGGMVPPAVKASALKSIIDKMDKLDAEKAKLLKAAAPTKPAAEPSPAPETGIPVSAVKAESEKDSPAPAAAEASIAAEPAASPIAAAVTALQGVVADLARAVNPEAAAKPVASEYSESATPAPESAAKRSEATTTETKTPADSLQKPPILSGKEGGGPDKNELQYGASNTVVTQDDAKAARAILKSKLGQLNAGIDPEIIKAGLTLAAYHVEAGARSFAAYSKAMVSDLGETVAPYLREWYEAVRGSHAFDGMTLSDEIEKGSKPAVTALPPGRFVSAQSMTITKRGRKWFEAHPDGKAYSVKVEINSASDSWAIDSRQTFPAMVDVQSNKYGTTTTIYPLTKEQESAASVKAVEPELHRWLGYVEEKAPSGYIYQNGIDKLRALGIARFPALNDRLSDAITRAKGVKTKEAEVKANASAETAAAEAKMVRHNLAVPYEKKDFAKSNGARWDANLRTWYVLGNVPSALEKYLPAGDRKLQNGHFWISQGEGYGGRPYTQGETIPNPYRNSKASYVTDAQRAPEYVTVVEAQSRYHKYDGMSFGVGDESGHVYSAIVKPATTEAARPIQQAEERAQQRKVAQQELNQLEREVIERGERPDGMHAVEGERLGDTQNIYGSGDWWIIQPDAIWYVRNNGMDGDNWSANNVRTGGAGAIGWRIPFDSAFAQKLRDLVKTVETRDTDHGTALYSRNKPSKGALNIETAPATPAIEELNAAVEKKEGITNAFLSAKFNDEGLANAYKSAFGVEVVYVSPTSEAASQFLGIHYGGKIYVNPDNPHHGFIQLAGHELLHQLRRDRQDLYNFLAAKAESYRVPGAAERYSKRLESVGGTGFDVQEETLADFTGDALADPNFLKALAENNPSKFRQLLTAVVSWLKRVATKLYGKGFRSSEYFTDVNALKDYLAAVLSAYSEQKTQSVIDGVEPPSFSRAQDQTQTPEFRAWFGVSKVVDADGKPLVVYWGGEEGITEFEGSREFSSEKDNVQPVFFTKHKALAKQYAKAIDGGGEVYGVYLSIQNPLVVYGSETVSGRMSIDVIARKLELAQKNGNDGIIFKGVQDSPYVTKSHGPVTDIYVAFSPTQIKSAIGNTGTFDPTNPDIRYSRAAVQGGVGQGAREVFSDIVRSDRTLNRVISKFNTPFHIAETRPEFKPVYDEAQDYNQDVSRFANEGADLAPDLLPRIESFADFKKQTPNSEDVANTADALYAGTLWGGGSPLEGRVWSDSELKSGRAEDGDVALPANFKPMNDKQISLYRQALAAVAHSLTEHSKSLIWRLAKQKDIQLNSSVSLGRMASLADTMAEQQIEGKRASLEEAVADDKPKIQKEIDELEAFRKAVADIEEKTNGLIEHGYFPAMRFGQYAVNVQTLKDGKWTEEYFGRFETQTAANLAKRELIKEFPNSQVTSGVMNTDAYKLFQGLNLDSLELFAKHMTDESGKPVDIDPIMQEYFRIATTERSTLKRQIHRKGTPGFSKDVARALAQFTVSNATATSRAYHAAGMMEKVQRIKAGDLQAYATRYVRYLQDPQEEAAMLRGFLANYYILGSIAFGAVNMTQPILMTAPYLSEHTSWTNAMKQLGIAAKDLVTGRKSLTPDEKAAYEKAVKAGTVAPQEIHQIRAEGRASMMGDSPLWQKMEAIAESRGIKMPGKLLMRKAAFLWGSIYSLTESWNRGITFLAAYRIAKAKGGVNPYDFAKNAVDATQGVYAKSNRPEISRGAVGSAVMTFKQFSIAYVELAKRLYDHDKKAFAVLMLTLMALAGAEGLPFAEDIEDLIDTIGQWMGYATNTKKALRKRATEILGKDIADMMLHGASAIPGMPIDVAQRMGMHNLIPGSATLKTSEPDKTRDIVELLGPAAGLFKNTGTAIEGVATGKPGNLKMLLPLALQNVAKGAEIAETGQFRDMKGRKVMDADLMDAMVKLVGFQPAKVAQESRIVGQNMQDIGLQKVIESSIADKWARGIADNDPAKVAEARQQMREWNADNPELRVIINPGQIARRVKELRLSREQRFLKSAPREIRGGMRQDLGR